MNERAAQTYKNQQVNTASPAKMVYMLFEKTLACLQEVLRAIESKDIQSRCNANCKAQELIAHLSNTLDMDQGGEIATNLERLYAHCMIRLMGVDRHNDPEAAKEVIHLLTPLRDSWAALADKSENEMRQAIMTAQQSQPQPQMQPVPQPQPQSAGNGDENRPRSSGLSISA
ncbi:flagellar export chaperone FliS [Thalassospira alkalitolerans]|uniref:flagellar export chaperone FliS n=1 Tax=Thalassospira alkalitolerans TaxID=1293890 RepID=UPI0030EB91F9|tara:strand:- start:2657 stop:3172 length:516 start_codon:yes stop_codon:yes gene_type:complete